MQKQKPSKKDDDSVFGVIEDLTSKDFLMHFFDIKLPAPWSGNRRPVAVCTPYFTPLAASASRGGQGLLRPYIPSGGEVTDHRAAIHDVFFL